MCHKLRQVLPDSDRRFILFPAITFGKPTNIARWQQPCPQYHLPQQLLFRSMINIETAQKLTHFCKAIPSLPQKWEIAVNLRWAAKSACVLWRLVSYLNWKSNRSCCSSVVEQWAWLQWESWLCFLSVAYGGRDVATHLTSTLLLPSGRERSKVATRSTNCKDTSGSAKLSPPVHFPSTNLVLAFTDGWRTWVSISEKLFNVQIWVVHRQG